MLFYERNRNVTFTKHLLNKNVVVLHVAYI